MAIFFWISAEVTAQKHSKKSVCNKTSSIKLTTIDILSWWGPESILFKRNSANCFNSWSACTIFLFLVHFGSSWFWLWQTQSKQFIRNKQRIPYYTIHKDSTKRISTRIFKCNQNTWMRSKVIPWSISVICRASSFGCCSKSKGLDEMFAKTIRCIIFQQNNNTVHVIHRKLLLPNLPSLLLELSSCLILPHRVHVLP